MNIFVWVLLYDACIATIGINQSHHYYEAPPLSNQSQHYYETVVLQLYMKIMFLVYWNYYHIMITSIMI